PIWALHSETFPHFPNEGGTLQTLSTNRTLRFWDVALQTLQRTVPLPCITDSTQRFHFALRGNRLAAADDDGIITLHDTKMGGVIGKFKAHAGGIQALTFSPDARLLATAGADNTIKLWDMATQKELAGVSSHKESAPQGSLQSARGLAFSPDGSLLASASFAEMVGILRVATGQAEAPLTGIKQGCAGVAFAPDGRTLAVACEDGNVRLWNLATRREVLVLRHGKVSLLFVEFSPDGRTLVSVCEKGTMHFWDAPSPTITPPSTRR